MKETLITSNKSAFIEKIDFQYNGQIGLITYHFKTGHVITYKAKTQQDLYRNILRFCWRDLQ